jgi:threonine aldolase
MDASMSDFRSDTVTKPTPAMRQAMFEAPLGDDVFGDDPSVNRLQEVAADMLGFEAAIFAASGTQANLMGMMSHCERGDEAIVGQQWHTYKWEAGGMAVLGSIQPQPLENQADGTIRLEDIAAAIKPDDAHFARSKLVVLENTTGGKVLPLQYVQQVSSLVRGRGLSMHLDGARLMNAAAALAKDSGTSVAIQARLIAQEFDSVSLCLSKGLGAPVGSLLLGNRAFISKARRIRKMLGGGMRQAGVLAAAGLYALEHNLERLHEDHANMRQLQAALAAAVQGNEKLVGRVQVLNANTNILFIELDGELADLLVAHLLAHGIHLTVGAYGAGQRKRIRWVTHLDVSQGDVAQAAQAVLAY